MRRRLVAAIALATGLAGSAAGAASLRLDSFTIPLSQNVNVAAAPVRGVTGATIATGFNMSSGLTSFVAWCLDLTHSISRGGPYEYARTATPFSNSFLASGAARRVQSVFDANYGTLDVGDRVQAAAFQLSLWEVAYDDDFSLLSGDFRGSGHGRLAEAIGRAASGYLTAARNHAGRQAYDVTFLESRDARTRQNLVTASPGTAAVPIPPALPLMLGAFGLLVSLTFAGAGRRT